MGTRAAKGDGFAELAAAVETNLDMAKIWRMLDLDLRFNIFFSRASTSFMLT